MRAVLPAALFVAAVALVFAVAWTLGLHIAQAGETKHAEVKAAGVVRGIDRPGARVKVKHPALLGELKEGDHVDFTLERSGLGWVVVSLSKK